MQTTVSYHQERLWFIDRFERGNLYKSSPIYHNIPFILKIKEELDKELLERALTEVINRHEALRTRVITIDHGPIQWISQQEEFKLEFHDLSGNREGLKKEDDGCVLDRVLEDANKPFLIEKDLLIRGKLFKIEEAVFILLLAVHHIITDYYSLHLLIKEMFLYYREKKEGKEPQLPSLKLQYADFARWQKEFPLRALKPLQFYWKRQLRGKLQPLELPIDRQRAMVHIYKGARKTFYLDHVLTGITKKVAKQMNRSLAVLLLGAFKVLMFRYSGLEEIIVGTSLDNRNQPGTESIIGPIANLVVLRSELTGEMTFSDFLNRLNQTFSEAQRYGAMPFDRLVTEVDPHKDMSRTAFFDVLFQYRDRFPGLENPVSSTIEIIETNLGWGKYDLNMLVEDKGSFFSGIAVYNAEYYDDWRISRMVDHFINILAQVCAIPDLRLKDLDILTGREKEQLLGTWSGIDRETDYPQGKLIHEIFEEQEQHHADRVAVIGKSSHQEANLPDYRITIQLTYRELNENAESIASLLKKNGVIQDTIVGITASRTLEMVAGILGILKTGGAYLPIDPDYPQERIDFMLKESGAKIRLTLNELYKLVDSPSSLSVSFVPSVAKIPSPATSLAYVIYTSGSTGRPKGVMITHRNVIRLLINNDLQFSFGIQDVWTMFHSPCFDFSVWEMYGALLFGGKLLLISKSISRDTREFFQVLKNYQVTVLNQTPSAFYALMNEESSLEETPLNIRYIIFGGEALSPGKIRDWHVRYPLTRLINMYGITETTVHVTFKEITDKEIKVNIGNIGKPIPTLFVYILDNRLEPVPVGAPGELFVGGAGLARGYLNQPLLTAERFINNPYKSGTRLYKSGDLARYLNTGEIEYLGRLDTQVQLRGFRVELGEIENQLMSCSGVKEAVVNVWEDEIGDMFLCAYIVRTPVAQGNELDREGLRTTLLQVLPGYMIPAFFIPLEQIPLTVNGKIDRKALPAPRIEGKKDYIAPRDEIEQKLVEIWSDILEIDKQKISIDSNFFHMGGHSLKATMLVSRIHKELNINVPLAEIFKAPQVQGQAAFIKKASRSVHIPVEPAEIKEYYPLSSAQRRLYLLQRMDDQEGISYNMPSVWRIQGELEEERFRQVFQQLIQRHESLRTFFTLVNDEPVQIIHKEVKFEIEHYVIVDGAVPAPGSFIRPFDLSQSPLLRVALVGKPTSGREKKKENRQINRFVMIDMHHIISDGLSTGILIKEFMQLYTGKQLPRLKLQYKDFSQWHNSEAGKIHIKKQETYWLKQFIGEIPVLHIPLDYPRPSVQKFTGQTMHFEMNREVTAKLKSLTREYHTTMFMLLLSLYIVLLAKLSQQEDVVVGTPITGRGHTDLEGIIGMFVNTLALRNFPSLGKPFDQFLKEIKENTINAFENRDYLYEDLVELVKVERNTGRNPLFDTFFTFQNMDIPEIRMQELSLIPFDYENHIAKFDLQLTAAETGETISFTLQYCTHLFKETTIQRFIGFFKRIVSVVLENIETRISDIDILSEEEKNRLLEDFNRAETENICDKTIHYLFSEQVETSADRVALAGGEAEKKEESIDVVNLSYKELEKKSAQLAQLLVEKGVRADSIVGIKIERSVEMVIRILGILKAGGAYMPIDPDYPEERIQYMVKDSRTQFILFGNELSQLFQSTSFLSVPSMAKNSSPPTSLAYIIYTSGSTGKPKGVMVNHRPVVNLLLNLQKQYPLLETDAYLLKTSFTFDVSVTELFGWFPGGGRLVILNPGEEKDPTAILNILERCRVTHVNFVPSMFGIFLEMLNPGNIKKLLSLRYIFLAGEVLSPELVKRTEALNIESRLENLYGPTEATVYATGFSLSHWDKMGQVPIGKPMTNCILMILDRGLRILPVGIPGQLCIGGAGLARGYLNQPGLTAERFIELSSPPSSTYTHPFTYSTIYQTGDLARWKPEGDIEFLGRMDYQVKIRGFRIELGEIENQLLVHENIKEAVVLAREHNNEKELCVYIVLKTGDNTQDSETAIKEYLSSRLPVYMIPAYFVFLSSFPLNPSGKIDRKALPEPELQGWMTYVAPRNRVETKLTEIWANILGLDTTRIGIDDNFFHLGGHSLKAALMVSRIHKELNVKMKLPTIFKTSTIRGLASYIEKSVRENYVAIEPAEKRQYYPLSSVQKRLYVMQQLDPGSTTYNVPSIMILSGFLRRQQFTKALDAMIQRHEILRTSFELVNGEPVQRINDAVNFELNHFAVLDGEVPAIDSFIRPFDLSQAPLLRVVLIEQKPGNTGPEIQNGQSVLIMDMHHIISDGTSAGVFFDELMFLYENRSISKPRLHYKDFSQWQNSSAMREVINLQELYWLEEFSGEIPVLQIIPDFPRPPIQQFDGNTLNFQIDEQKTRGLNELAQSHKATLFIVLLALYNIVLAKLSGQEDIVIGTPIAARRHVDLERLLGMFVNTLPLRNFPLGEETFSEFLNTVKEKTLQALANQEYPFADLVEKVTVERDMSRNPLFDVMFIFQNMLDPTGYINNTSKIEVDGLKVTSYDIENQTAKFDLTLTAVERQNRLYLSIEYCTKLFKKETIEQLITYFRKIISIVKNYPGIRISQIQILTETEKQQLLNEFNNTGREFSFNKMAHELFTMQAKQTPHHIALIGEGSSMGDKGFISYNVLDRRSSELAGILRKHGTRSGMIVGLGTERTVEMIIGILGILKTGSAYLPISDEYPEERIKYIETDSNIKLWVRNGDISKSTGQWETPNGNHLAGTDSSLVYVIYTSGSTGKPKGVIIRHESLINFIMGMKELIDFKESDKVLCLTEATFDIFGLETLVPLIFGASVIIGTQEQQHEPAESRLILEKEQATVFQATPSRLQLLLASDREKTLALFSQLRYVLVGGEPLPGEMAEQLGKAAVERDFNFYNLYGPTETTIWSSAKNMSGQVRLTIGKPIANTQIYIFDKYNNLVPPGIIGEICIGGRGIALGYLNRPALTAEKFDQDLTYFRDYHDKKFCGGPGGGFSKKSPGRRRLYKTGDLGRWLVDGEIEFLGRVDFQVKIRGHRIELGEIENCLQGLHEIEKVVVTDRVDETGDRYLTAYYVMDKPIENSKLVDHLSRQLPVYMIPSYFVHLQEIPLTMSGKVDRKSLPEPVIGVGDRYRAPCSQLEIKLARLWSEILGIPIEKIGVDDNFFHLGGHSLKAALMVARLHKLFNVKVPLPEVFKTSTIRGLATFITGAIREKYISIEPVEKREFYPLSSAQRRLYILMQLDPESTVYNIPAVMILTGSLQLERLTKVLGEMVRRHESLRTSFDVVNGEPVQRIHDGVKFEIDHHVSVEGAVPDPGTFIRPFELSHAPLLRVNVIRENQQKHYLLVDMHHIISDGTSTGVFFNELMALYDNRTLQKPRLQYKDFSQWQNSVDMKEAISLQEFYWLEEFKREIPVLHIMTDYPRPPFQQFEGKSIRFQAKEQETQALKQMAQTEGATLFMVLLASYTILLAKLSSQDDIVVGTPIAGRRHADLGSIIGMFVNTLALRNAPVGNKSFSEFLQSVKTKTLQAFDNQEYPFETLVEKVILERDVSRNPLFDVMFILQDRFIASVSDEKTTDTEISGLNISPYEYENQTVRFDLTLNAIEKNGILEFTLDYCSKLFKKATIEKFITYFGEIIFSVINNPEIKISQIQILTEHEKQQILMEFNDTGKEYPFNKTVHEMFTRQAKQTLHHVALIGEGSSFLIGRGCHSQNRPSHPPDPPQKRLIGTVFVTYAELERKSSALACLLKESGILPGMIVGLNTERTVEMLIGILGILKTGSAYLPISSEYPEKRLKYILADSNVTFVVGNEQISGYWPEMNNRNSLDKLTGTVNSSFLTKGDVNATSLAYVIYTSGSTGRPKGVVIGQASLMNFIKGMTELIDFNESDKVLCLTEATFDIFGLETLVPLTCGSTIIVGNSKQQHEPEEARLIMEKGKATVFQATPSRLQLLLAYDREKTLMLFRHLRFLLVGGEAISREIAEQLGEEAAQHGYTFYNLYGPTETTIWSSVKNLSGQVPLTIGKPIVNTRIYILDKYNNLVPPGITGEICIAGCGLAFGYLNRPELTAEKFDQDLTDFQDYRDKKFCGGPGGGFPKEPPGRRRLYKTGDLGRWLVNGEIEFLGRVDFQVKIRGHRIELSEIEQCLLNNEEIKEVVAIDKLSETGDRFLVVYFIAEQSIDTGTLREQTGKRLPRYMVPSYFVQIDKIPLTVSGKIDRKALPEPGTQDKPTGISYRPPTTEEEKILAGIWKEILGIDQIGLDDNFFTSGGHSLQAVRVISRIREIFNLEVSLRFLFENPTVQRLAEAITHMQLETVEQQDLDKLLTQIESMSEQEAELLLNRLKS